MFCATPAGCGNITVEKNFPHAPPSTRRRLCCEPLKRGSSGGFALPYPSGRAFGSRAAPYVRKALGSSPSSSLPSSGHGTVRPRARGLSGATAVPGSLRRCQDIFPRRLAWTFDSYFVWTKSRPCGAIFPGDALARHPMEAPASNGDHSKPCRRWSWGRYQPRSSNGLSIPAPPRSHRESDRERIDIKPQRPGTRLAGRQFR